MNEALWFAGITEVLGMCGFGIFHARQYVTADRMVKHRYHGERDFDYTVLQRNVETSDEARAEARIDKKHHAQRLMSLPLWPLWFVDVIGQVRRDARRPQDAS